MLREGGKSSGRGAKKNGQGTKGILNNSRLLKLMISNSELMVELCLSLFTPSYIICVRRSKDLNIPPRIT